MLIVARYCGSFYPSERFYPWMIQLIQPLKGRFERKVNTCSPKNYAYRILYLMLILLFLFYFWHECFFLHKTEYAAHSIRSLFNIYTIRPFNARMYNLYVRKLYIYFIICTVYRTPSK